ncbi:8515_t:CDS:2, partial [Entrophospora sp. SA101]
PVKIGGEMDEKKISNSVSRSEDAFASDIFAVNKPITIKNLSKYLRKKNMDQIEEIDIPQSSDTVNKANDKTKPQIPDSSRSINMKSSTSNADISQIVETKDFSEEAISKTDFIGNDQSYATKTKMAEILPIGALGKNLRSPNPKIVLIEVKFQVGDIFIDICKGILTQHIIRQGNTSKYDPIFRCGSTQK